MSDHGILSSPESSWFGIKLAFAVAGFWGGVISLSFVKNLTSTQGVLAVLTGIGSAVYGTPILVRYLLSAEPNESAANAIAFVVGLTAMNIIPGIVKLSEMWRANPLGFLKAFGYVKGSTNDDDK